MSVRARLYLLVGATRHLALGLFALLAAHRFNGPAFDGIKDAMPGPEGSDMLRWGLLFTATGLLCGLAAYAGKEGIARWALLASVCTTALMAGGFITVTINGTSAVTGLIGYIALTLKDLVVLRQPMRSPFEPLIRRVLDEPAR